MLCVLLRSLLNDGLVAAATARTRGKALSFLLAGFASQNARNDRFDRRLTLWPTANACCRSSKGFLAPSRPDSDRAEADAAKTAFLQACERPAYPGPRVAGQGILWRGHANQGRCQPGRRAVLEETKEPSDHRYSTLSKAFSQVRLDLKSVGIALFINYLRLAVFVERQESKRECLPVKRVSILAQE
jgi:hypothetical protein